MRKRLRQDRKLADRCHCQAEASCYCGHCKLTDAQKAQLQSYMNAVLPQITAARQQERQTEIALMTQLSAQIRSFLTTDQQARRAAESRRKDVFKMVSDTSLM